MLWNGSRLHRTKLGRSSLTVVEKSTLRYVQFKNKSTGGSGCMTRTRTPSMLWNWSRLHGTKLGHSSLTVSDKSTLWYVQFKNKPTEGSGKYRSDCTDGALVVLILETVLAREISDTSLMSLSTEAASGLCRLSIQYRSRDKHQVPREIPREFAGYHAGVCGISRGSLRDLLREFAGSPAGFIGISRGTKSSPATPIFGGMQTPSVGPGVPTPRRHRNRTSPAAAAALADSPAPTDHVAFWRANHSAQMGTRPPAGPRIQRVESNAPPHRNTA
ncbi:hypothetical protein Bbelb_164220 [Branchiostoma belcheri]|nr:hypothetical protein Bbelb_164220 [Branchiostoma belcheri]